MVMDDWPDWTGWDGMMGGGCLMFLMFLMFLMTVSNWTCYQGVFYQPPSRKSAQLEGHSARLGAPSPNPTAPYFLTILITYITAHLFFFNGRLHGTLGT